MQKSKTGGLLSLGLALGGFAVHQFCAMVCGDTPAGGGELDLPIYFGQKRISFTFGIQSVNICNDHFDAIPVFWWYGTVVAEGNRRLASAALHNKRYPTVYFIQPTPTDINRLKEDSCVDGAKLPYLKIMVTPNKNSCTPVPVPRSFSKSSRKWWNA